MQMIKRVLISEIAEIAGYRAVFVFKVKVSHCLIIIVHLRSFSIFEFEILAMQDDCPSRDGDSWQYFEKGCRYRRPDSRDAGDDEIK